MQAEKSASPPSSDCDVPVQSPLNNVMGVLDDVEWFFAAAG
ncbi:MAG TPA: hypothetical protein VK824_10320 [Planctomycetota bacterium]|nr:hypothetical protein [Planctomycetota bacterium]